MMNTFSLLLASIQLSFFCILASKVTTAPGVIRVEYFKSQINDSNILPREAQTTLDNPVNLTMKGVFYFPETPKPTLLPLVIFLHGNHDACKNTTSNPPIVTKDPPSYPGECAPGLTEIPSNLGYEYIANELVPKGFAVMAPNFNSLNLYNLQVNPQPLFYCKFYKSQSVFNVHVF
jgi:hypothetical protein